MPASTEVGASTDAACSNFLLNKYLVSYILGNVVPLAGYPAANHTQACRALPSWALPESRMQSHKPHQDGCAREAE
jgi:hypothetical protein